MGINSHLMVYIGWFIPQNNCDQNLYDWLDDNLTREKEYRTDMNGNIYIGDKIFISEDGRYDSIECDLSLDITNKVFVDTLLAKAQQMRVALLSAYDNMPEYLRLALEYPPMLRINMVYT